MAVGKDAARTRLPATVIVLGLTSFFTDVGSEMVFPLLPAFVAGLGASPAFLGLVEGLASATASFLKLASGHLADRTRHPKRLVVAGYALASMVRPLVGLAAAPWHVLAVRVTDRIGKGIRTTPRDAMIAGSVAKADSGRAFGFHAAMDHAGAVVGPLVATLLLAFGLSVRTVFLATIVPGVIAVVLVLLAREPPQVGLAPAPVPSSDTDRSPLPGELRRYLGVVALFALGNSSDAFLLLRAQELGLSIASLPLLWSLFHVVKVLASYLGGSWSDRTPRRRVILLGWGVFAVMYVALGVATEPWHAWVLFVVYGAFDGLTAGPEKALVADLAPASARGRAFGAYHFVVGVAAVPAGLLTGWLWGSWGSKIALVASAAIAAAAALALLATSPRAAPPPPPAVPAS